MRQARILDVLRAVSEVAATHPEIEAWWYAPAGRLRLRGELPQSGQQKASIEVVVEARSGSGDLDGIAAELSRRLPGGPVSVRLHRGVAEGRQLFRLRSDRSPAGRSAKPGASGDSSVARTP